MNQNEINQEELEQAIEIIQRAWDDVLETLRKWWEQIRQALIAVAVSLQPFIQSWLRLFTLIHRWAAFIYLLQKGLPFRLANWIARYCPVKWLYFFVQKPVTFLLSSEDAGEV